MKAIIGLGNPGKQYEYTRHNIGFMTIDCLARELDISVDQAKFKALYGEGRYKDEKIVLLKHDIYELVWGVCTRGAGLL